MNHSRDAHCNEYLAQQLCCRAEQQSCSAERLAAFRHQIVIIGKRVEDSSTEIDWDTETIRDILGATYGTMKKPTVKQTFDPCDLDSDDAAQVRIWNLAVKDQDYNALAAQDMLLVHFYAGAASYFETAPFLFQGND